VRFPLKLILVIAVALAVSNHSAAQVPDAKAEALVSCADPLEPAPLTPYGFAKSTLVSLWHARHAVEQATGLKKETAAATNYLSLVTAMMRATKASTNDFICAKRSVAPFTGPPNDENTRIAASALALTYDAHIDINQRGIELLKKLDSTNQGELADQLSTLQVERDQRWSDIVQPTAMALLSLIDPNHTDDNGNTDRLIVTKAQKEELLAWAGEHFPEFKNGTPKDKWSDPTKTAELFIMFFKKGRKCSDE
jgi:hypothetical protein